MIAPVQRDILNGLAQILELSPPDIRIGQLVAFLAFLAEDDGRPGIGDVDDVDLLKAAERHLADLRRLQQARAEVGVTSTPP